MFRGKPQFRGLVVRLGLGLAGALSLAGCFQKDPTASIAPRPAASNKAASKSGTPGATVPLPSPGPGACGAAGSFTRNFVPVMNATCVSCHMIGGAGAGKLLLNPSDLTSSYAAAYAKLDRSLADVDQNLILRMLVPSGPAHLHKPGATSPDYLGVRAWVEDERVGCAVAATPSPMPSATPSPAPTATGTPAVNSPTFSCGAGATNASSIAMRRLLGTELVNSYVAAVPSAAWNASAVQNSLYLLPVDSLYPQISLTYNSVYSVANYEYVTRFNEALAQAIVASAANLQAFFGACATTTAFDQACYTTFMNGAGARILRGPVSASEITTLWNSVKLGPTARDRENIAVQMLFNDVRFIFLVELGAADADAAGLIPLTSYEVANRLAYGLTQAPPDNTLWAAAQAGQLTTLANVNAQVERLAQTPAYQTTVLNAVKYYLDLQPPSVPTGGSYLAGLNAMTLAAQAERELDEYIRYVYFTSTGNMHDLYTSTAAFPPDASLQSILGTAGVWTTGAAPQNASNHPGILTRPYATLRGRYDTPLIHRGAQMRKYLLCDTLAAPDAVLLAQRPPLTTQDQVKLTNRDLTAKATNMTPPVSPACAGCHNMINGLGFLTGRYDAAGRYVSSDTVFDANGNPMLGSFNGSGVFVPSPTGSPVVLPIDTQATPAVTPLDNTPYADLAAFERSLMSQPKVTQCMTRRMLHYFTKSVEDTARDGCLLYQVDGNLLSGKKLRDTFLLPFNTSRILYKKKN